jgi:radical SAM protein with 4Fe4S-binding SPASM domain
VNSVQRLEEIKAFMRMGGNASDLKMLGWNGDGKGANGTAEHLASMPGIVQDPSGELHFAEWNCRAGQNNVIIRTDGTLAPCFPMYASTCDWGNIDKPKFDNAQLNDMKKSCQRHCFSTLNHNLAYCYDDARVIKFVWTQLVKNRLKGGARSFEDWGAEATTARDQVAETL